MNPVGKAIHVLLVEDDEDDYVITRDLLDGVGEGSFRLEWIAEYGEAVRAVRERSFDVILLDYRLGGHTGDDFIADVRDYCTAPIVLLTGQADRETDMRMMRLGAADFLVKSRLDAQVLERALRYAAERARSSRDLGFLAAIVRGSHDAIIGYDLEGVIQSWNPAAGRLYGYAAEEVMGESARILFPPEREDELDHILARIATGEDVADLETVRLRRDGSPVPVALTVSPVLGPAGRVVGASAIAHDITRRREMEEQLRQAQKMEAVGKLAGGIAHDFNNLLTAILGNAELLLLDIPAGDPLRQDVEEIRGAADRAASLTRQILAFSRRQNLQPVVLDLNSTVAVTDRLMRRRLGGGIDLVGVMAPDLGRVRADPTQMEQVLLNLLTNARDALPHGGRIVVETRNVAAADLPGKLRRPADAPDDLFVSLAVSDDGVGIAPENLGRVFEPFFTTRPQGQGTGLGLSSVIGIVEQSGGRIDLTSEVGEGTTVRVFLPGIPAPEPETAALSGARGGSGQVLLVEDEHGVRVFARRVLERSGYSVLAAENGEEALRVFDAHQQTIRAVVTDAVMPLMGGHELKRRLAARGSRVPVLLVSGFTRERIPGAFLSKPFSAEDLVRAVRDLLGSHRETEAQR
jgi:PAS domain S-box-containing protein